MPILASHSTSSTSSTHSASILGALRPALVVFVVLSIVTGIVYPLATTGVAQGLFPEQAAGSLIRGEGGRDGRVVGSSLIGQSFTRPGYFWGRPSATSGKPYDAANSGGSNLGPLNPALVDAVRARIAALRAADPGNLAPVPVDLVTASASGLDPEISLAAAEYQVNRVARARGLAPAVVHAQVERLAQRPLLGFLGEPRVNVLALNLALDGVAR